MKWAGGTVESARVSKAACGGGHLHCPHSDKPCVCVFAWWIGGVWASPLVPLFLSVVGPGSSKGRLAAASPAAHAEATSSDGEGNGKARAAAL